MLNDNVVDILIAPGASYSPNVFAKTGTFSLGDPLNRRTIITGKGVVGYRLPFMEIEFRSRLDIESTRR